MDNKELLIRKYFEEHSFVEDNIKSFNSFAEWRLQRIVNEISHAVPAVIPPDAEEVKFVFEKIRIEKPSIIEADGAKRRILPSEARLRNLTYSAPVFLEITLLVDGKERERTEVQIAELPVMIKSSLCYLKNMGAEEMIAAGEDIFDNGGYFIINGTERILILLEDLAPNTIFVSKETTGPATHSAKIFSASGTYRIPHTIERTKDGLFFTSFTSIRRIPAVVLFKALGLLKDQEIVNAIGLEDVNEDLYINLFEYLDIKTEGDAFEAVAKSMKLPQLRDQRTERVQYMMDNFLFPHIGTDKKDRFAKAQLLGRIMKKILLFKDGIIGVDDKDHYMNKRVRLSGDLLEELFRSNMKVLVSDMLYIFQRGVRRGKILPIHSIVRTKLLTSQIRSAMATGNWTSNRPGVSQRLDRENQLSALSHIQRVVSLLTSSQENFKARELHSTHFGRLCPIESPEGKNIGLRKNLALLANITPELRKKEVEDNLKIVESFGLEKAGTGK